MIAPGLRVPRERGEEVRRALREAGALRTDLEISREAGALVFPLVEGAPVPDGVGTPAPFEFRAFGPVGPSDYRDRLAWTRDARAALPRSFDVVGDIVLVRLAEEVRPRRAEVGEALLGFVPGARIVGLDHGVHGAERRRSVERIAGSGGWRTRHRENGVEIEVDVERAYFSPRLAREHQRVASEVAEGDRVYDFCCGVGPFALTIARDGRARQLTAVDANPAAIELLRASLVRARNARLVAPVEASLEAYLPNAEPREKVILNLPLEGIKYLPSVARTVAPRGRLYYYEVTPRTDLERRTEAVVESLGPKGAWTRADRHVVHPYSPSSDLVAFVLERGRS